MRAWLAPLLALAAGCGELLVGANDDDPASRPPASAEAGAQGTSGDAGEAGPGASGEAGGDGAPACTTRVLEPSDDVSPGVNDCGGANTHGTDTFLNLGACVALLKFAVPVEVRDAIVAGKARNIRLSFVVDLGPGVMPTNGQLAVHVLRNDWSQGTSGGNYDGPDSCRRTSGDPGLGWGAAAAPPSGLTKLGPTFDFGPSVGAQGFTPASKDVGVLLDPASLLTAWTKFDATRLTLSLFVEELTANGVVVVASREHPSLPHPALSVDVCP